jgi:GrpB-like predicted nucleotidyltransferase (UPF0157 family)
MTDQPVAIVGYDPGWPDRFGEQRPVVEELLQPWLAGPVRHIGSTAVPGLSAKPVIDMLAPVGSLAGAGCGPGAGRGGLAVSNAKGSFVAQALRRAGIDPPHRDALPEDALPE